MILSVQNRRKKLITLTPLIDVVFILLLFFMLSSSFLKWKSIELTIDSTNGGVTSDSRSLLLRLIDDQTVGLSGRRMHIDDLPIALAAVRAKSNPKVMIESRDTVSMQSMLDVFDYLEKVGLTQYGLVVQ